MASQYPAATRPLAVVTGASSGIGLELARCAAQDGYDVIAAADTSLDAAARELQPSGVQLTPVLCDLATEEGVNRLLEAIGARTVSVLVANAGHGLGRAFLDQDFGAIRHVIDTNITGTTYLIHNVAQRMVANGAGRILITGSIAGYMPGSFQAVYNGTKAFIDSFALALANELKDTGVTVTCLMPGVTDTEFFERADLMDTQVGTQENKMDAGEVAEIGWKAMLKGETDVVAGLKNKLQVAMSGVLPKEVAAEQHRKMAEPGTARKR